VSQDLLTPEQGAVTVKIKVTGTRTLLDTSDGDWDNTNVSTFYNRSFEVPLARLLPVLPEDWKPGEYDLAEAFYGDDEKLLSVAANEAGLPDMFEAGENDRFEAQIANSEEIEHSLAPSIEPEPQASELPKPKSSQKPASPTSWSSSPAP